jgi:hypothetical protein
MSCVLGERRKLAVPFEATANEQARLLDECGAAHRVPGAVGDRHGDAI